MQSRARHKSILAALSGNTLEWFDLSLYAYFSVTIAQVFFPTQSAQLSLFLAFSSFAVAFAARPLGAIVIGAYADKHGMKKGLLLSMGLMLAGTFLIAVMPSYQAIGVSAPLGIALARLLQGFSAGGEFGSATVLMLAQAPRHRRVFFASLQFSSQGLGIVLASLFAYLLTSMLSPQQLLDWGWRLPFVFGLLIGPVGMYVRSSIDEPVREGPEPSAAREQSAQLSQQAQRILIAMALMAVAASSNFMLKFLPSYAVSTLHMSQPSVFLATLTAGLILLLLTPLAAFFLQERERIKTMQLSLAVYLLAIIPAFVLLQHLANLGALLSTVALIAILQAIYLAPLASILGDVVPQRRRISGISLSYQLGSVIFGALAPVIVTGLTLFLSAQLAPAFYLALTASVSWLALVGARRVLAAIGQ